MADGVCPGSTSVGDDLRGHVHAKSFEGIGGLLRRGVIGNQSGGALLAEAAVKLLAESHATAGGPDDGNLRPKTGGALQNLIERADEHMRGAVESPLPPLHPVPWHEPHIVDLRSAFAAGFTDVERAYRRDAIPRFTQGRQRFH